MDYHIHTKASPDATGEFIEFIREAEKKGIDEIGFSDHTILHFEKDYPYRPPDSMQKYIQEFLRVKSESKIPVRLGAEVDFFAADVDEIRNFLEKYPFDYVMGSVHYLGNWNVDSTRQMHEYSKRNILQVYEEYFASVRKLCRTRLFDVLGHADLIKIFGFRPDSSYDGILEETARALASTGMCVEVNTSGLIRPCKEMYPSSQFLALLRKNGVPITFGSDAHRPSDVGRLFDQAVAQVKELGFKQACTFEARKRQLHAI
jgi:histidinol-phosphatase (PHP family)